VNNLESLNSNFLSKLDHQLDELIEVYQGLQKHLLIEKEVLIAANIDKVIESNQIKENFLQKLKTIDVERIKAAVNLAQECGGNISNPRLLELASLIGGQTEVELKKKHSKLKQLIEKIQELNQDNVIYVNSALKNLNGALSEIKDAFAGSKTYKRQGKIQRGPDQAGNLVHRKA
jgi:flagellar biosynthesis/type III secretory pathway chaperone